jgi:hypothetical protein
MDFGACGNYSTKSSVKRQYPGWWVKALWLRCDIGALNLRAAMIELMQLNVQENGLLINVRGKTDARVKSVKHRTQSLFLSPPSRACCPIGFLGEVFR